MTQRWREVCVCGAVLVSGLAVICGIIIGNRTGDVAPAPRSLASLPQNAAAETYCYGFDGTCTRWASVGIPCDGTVSEVPCPGSATPTPEPTPTTPTPTPTPTATPTPPPAGVPLRTVVFHGMEGASGMYVVTWGCGPDRPCKMVKKFACDGLGDSTWSAVPNETRVSVGLYPEPTRANCRTKGSDCAVTVTWTDVSHVTVLRFWRDGVQVVDPTASEILPSGASRTPVRGSSSTTRQPNAAPRPTVAPAEVIRRRIGAAPLARRVGPIVAVQDQPWNPADPPLIETNSAAVARIADAGFRAVKVWPRTSVLSADFAAVMDDPRIDTVVIRPLAGAHWDNEHDYHYTHEVVDFGKLAQEMYGAYRDVPKTIVLSNCELDYQLRGWSPDPDVRPSAEIQAGMVALLDERQEAIARWRGVYPDSPLSIWHCVEVARAGTSHAFDATRDLLPRLRSQPDLVSYSWWASANGVPTIEQALTAIERATAMPRSRIILGEVGWYEQWGGAGQHARITAAINEAMHWGAGAAYVWSWSQAWEAPGAGSAFVHPVTGAPTDAFRAAIEAAKLWG